MVPEHLNNKSYSTKTLEAFCDQRKILPRWLWTKESERIIREDDNISKIASVEKNEDIYEEINVCRYLNTNNQFKNLLVIIILVCKRIMLVFLNNTVTFMISKNIVDYISDSNWW